MSRFGVAICWMLLIGAAPIQAVATDASPAAFVTTIYANGAEERVWPQWLNVNQRRKWLSSDLATLWDKVDAKAKADKDSMGALDFDVGANSQFLSTKNAQVKTLQSDAARAVVLARLHSPAGSRRSAREDEIRYNLVFERGRWLIDDIHGVVEPNEWSLRDMLALYLKS